MSLPKINLIHLSWMKSNTKHHRSFYILHIKKEIPNPIQKTLKISWTLMVHLNIHTLIDDKTKAAVSITNCKRGEKIGWNCRVSLKKPPYTKQIQLIIKLILHSTRMCLVIASKAPFSLTSSLQSSSLFKHSSTLYILTILHPYNFLIILVFFLIQKRCHLFTKYVTLIFCNQNEKIKLQNLPITTLKHLFLQNLLDNGLLKKGYNSTSLTTT